MNKRIGWIDITKGIAIILVILGHSIIGLKANDFIFSFHMPIFFIVSGILFKEKDVLFVIKHNAQRLLIPYAVTSGILIIARAISAYIQNWTMPQIKNLMINTFIGALFGYGVDEGRKWFFEIWRIGAIWFILAFFWSNIIIQIIYKYTDTWKEWQRGQLIIAVSAIGYIIGQYIWLPTNIDIGAFAILFMYIGILMKRTDILKKRGMPVICWVMVFVIWIYASLTGGINMVVRYVPGWLAIPGAVCGSIIIMRLSMSIDDTVNLSCICKWYGKNSMKILCVHLIEMLIVPWDYIVQQIAGYHMLINMFLIFLLRTVLITVITLIINALPCLYRKTLS